MYFHIGYKDSECHSELLYIIRYVILLHYSMPEYISYDINISNNKARTCTCTVPSIEFVEQNCIFLKFHVNLRLGIMARNSSSYETEEMGCHGACLWPC